MPPHLILKFPGANAGIGYDTSVLLSSVPPSNHILMGVCSLTKGGKILTELQANISQGAISLIELDVTDDTSIAAAVAQIDKDLGILDILIINAGISGTQGLPTSDEGIHRKARRAVFEANDYDPTLLTQEAPKIISVSSSLDSITMRSDPKNPYYSFPAKPYLMRKLALNMLSVCYRTQSKECGARFGRYVLGD